MSLKVMDVTLRESIYINDVILKENDAIDIVSGLSKANIDFIEIGYISARKSDNKFKSCSLELIDKLGANLLNKNTKLAVMIYPQDYDDGLLNCLSNEHIGLVRLCISNKNLYKSLKVIEKLKSNNILVSANLTRMSNLLEKDILQYINYFEKVGADYVYLADSNGAMLPNKVEDLFCKIRATSNIKLGFHPHDNLRTGTANALSAINAGIDIIDASIYGYGKGLANLPLQSFVALLKRIDIRKDISLNTIISTSNKLYNNALSKGFNSYLLNRECNILTGYYNMNLDLIKKLQEEAKQKQLNFIDILLNNIPECNIAIEGV